MLVLARKEGERIRLNNNIVLTMLRVHGDKVRVGIEAPDDVLVLRTVAGQRYIGMYNIEAIQRGNYPDPELYPNDIVMVGDSPSRRRVANILQFSPIFAPLILLLSR